MRAIGVGPLGGDPPDLPDPPGPKGTTGGGTTSTSDDVVPATVADTGSVLPILYGTMKVPALLIEKYGPLQRQPDPWLPATSYAVDAVVSNSGHAYKCTLAGASAASSGPSGTGAGIADGPNTLKWNYLGAAREWQPGAVYALNAYCTNGNYLWKATTAGTAGAAQGPSSVDINGNPVAIGTTRADGFGTLVWTAIGSIAPWQAATRYYQNYYGRISYVTNLGNAYQCVATGDSSSTPSGPTGQQSGPIIENPGTTSAPQWQWVQQLPYYINAQEFIAALAEGQCTAITNIWWDRERVVYPAKGLVFLSGPDALGQTVPAPFDQAGYQHTAGIYTLATSTGTQVAAPAIAVELNGIQFGGGTADVNPADILIDLWTHTRRGCALSSGRLDSSVGGAGAASFRTFCDAAGVRLSMLIDSQKTALAVLAQLLLATGCDAVWSGGVLKVVPLCDQSITAPVYGAVSFVPNSAADYVLGPDDFLDKFEPVQMVRRDDADVYNAWPVEYVDRASGYTKITAEDVDMLDFDARGELKRASTTSLQGIAFADGTNAVRLARNLAQRSLQIRNTYTFRVPWTKVLIEPGSLLLLNEPILGLVNQPVRVISFEEDVGSDSITVISEDYPAGASASGGYQPQQGDGLRPNDLGTEARAITTPSGTTSGVGTGVVNGINIVGGSVGAGQLGAGQIGRTNTAIDNPLNCWPNPTSEVEPPAGADASRPIYSVDWRRLLSGSAQWFGRVFGAPAWLASHAYSVGAAVINGGNGYVCTVAGTSAASGGPAGSGTSIVDGGVTWTWVTGPSSSSSFAWTTAGADPAIVADVGQWVRRLAVLNGSFSDTLSVAVPVIPGQSWVLRARGLASGPITPVGLLPRLVFYDANGAQLSYSTYLWAQYLTSWSDAAAYATAPAGATMMVASLIPDGTNGAAYVDQIVLQPFYDQIRGEVAGGLVNGSNIDFSISKVLAAPGTLRVYVSGQLQPASAYTTFPGNSPAFEFLPAYTPQAGEVVTVDYGY